MRKLQLLFLFGLYFSGFNTKIQAQSFDWVNRYGGSTWYDGVFFRDIKMEPGGNVLSCGSFNGTVDFDPGPGTTPLTASPYPGGYVLGDGFVMKSDTSGDLIWVKKFDGTEFMEIYSLDTDAAGNMYMLCIFSDTIDADPGPGVEFVSGGVCVIKLDDNGNFIWVRVWDNSTGIILPNLITVLQNGDLLINGSIRDSLDSDPGPGTSIVVNNHPIWKSGFVIRLDSNGNFIYSFLSGHQGSGPGIAESASGDLWICGWFDDLYDFDPGPGQAILNYFYGNGYLQHLDASGNFISVTQFEPYLTNLAFDVSGGIILAALIEGTMDADPGPGSFSISSNGARDICIIRMDTSGNFSWAVNYGSSDYDRLIGMQVHTDGSIYVHGGFRSTIDFDPGPSTYIIDDNFEREYFLKLDSIGNFVMVFPMTSVFNNTIRSPLLIYPSGSIYFCGSFKGMEDFDPGPGYYYLNQTFRNGYMLKLKPDTCSLLTFHIDVLSEVGCTQSGSAVCNVMSGAPPFQYLWNTVPPSNGALANFSSGGLYDILVSDNTGCSRSSTLLLTAPAYMNQLDVEVNNLCAGFRANQPSHFFLTGKNNGCSMAWGNMLLIKDPRVTVQSSIPPPDLIFGDSLFWFYNGMNYDSSAFTIDLFLQPDSTVGINDTLCFTSFIEPLLNDIVPSNNSKTNCYVVQASYDPNNKFAYPEGVCDEHFILHGEELTYTVLFQNTGSAPAYDVTIIDTLSPSLDPSTLRVISTSHPVHVNLLPGNVVRFHFDQIMLPASSSNLSGSHGFILFTCNPISQLPSGTMVSNSAVIVFDSNSAIITDSVYHTFVSSIPLPDTSVLVNGITLSAVFPGVSYQWVDCLNGNAPIPGANGQSFTPSSNGNYAVVVSNNGCSEMSSCYNITSVGIPESGIIPGVILYPNPTADFVNVIVNFEDETLIELYNIYGQIVYSSHFIRNKKLDTSRLNPGIFLYRITNDHAGTTTGYLILR